MDADTQAGFVMLVILLMWCAGAWFGFRRAVANGYSQFGAFIGGICLGPFAPLLALVSPNGKKCMFCRSVIDAQATVCPKCTREQIAPVVAAPPPPPPVVVAAPEPPPAPAVPVETEAQRRARIAERIRADEAARAERIREVERKHAAR